MHSIAKFYKVSFEQYKKDRLSALDINSTPSLNEELLFKEYESIKLPTRATAGSAGYDFYLPSDILIKQGQNILVPTGIRAEIEAGWVLLLFPRSGLGFKYGLRFLNTTGIIDSDYYFADNEGHIMAKLRAETKEDLVLHAQDRFMQGVFMPFGITKDDEPLTTKRTGGFGSTGNK
ncbi:MAG: dUTP diphosphatase [Eubacteriales bacterium]|nr:dUTP diphosphatase [Eubacteriales bacterium]